MIVQEVCTKESGKKSLMAQASTQRGAQVVLYASEDVPVVCGVIATLFVPRGFETALSEK